VYKMFALRAKDKLIAIEKKDREKKEKKILDRKRELQKFHEGLLPGDPRIGVVKRSNTAAKRTSKVTKLEICDKFNTLSFSSTLGRFRCNNMNPR